MNIEKTLSVAFLVPMGDPTSPRCRWGLNILLWGDPGIGKSDRVEAAGARVGLPVRTTYAATSQPEDVSGAAFVNTSKGLAFFEEGLTTLNNWFEDPDRDDGGLLAKFIDTPMIRKLVKGILRVGERYGKAFSRLEPLLPGVSDLIIDQEGVWFIDELSCARPAVQAGYLGAVLTKRVGGVQLPVGIRSVAAANPPESAAGGWELEVAMANRFCHFDVTRPSAGEWRAWLLNEGGEKFDSIENGEEIIRKRWPECWPVAKGLVSGFMERQPNLLHNMPPEGHKDRGRAWPSPRTWVFAARALATCLCLNESRDTIAAFVEGCVGEAAATHFMTWMNESNLPAPLDMLTNGWTPDKKRLDRTIAAYTAMAAYVVGLPKVEDQRKLAPAAWKCLQVSSEAGLLDITMQVAELLVKAGLDSSTKNPDIIAAAAPVLLRLGKRGMYNYVSNAP